MRRHACEFDNSNVKYVVGFCGLVCKCIKNDTKITRKASICGFAPLCHSHSWRPCVLQVSCPCIVSIVCLVNVVSQEHWGKVIKLVQRFTWISGWIRETSLANCTESLWTYIFPNTIRYKYRFPHWHNIAGKLSWTKEWADEILVVKGQGHCDREEEFIYFCMPKYT